MALFPLRMGATQVACSIALFASTPIRCADIPVMHACPVQSVRRDLDAVACARRPVLRQCLLRARQRERRRLLRRSPQRALLARLTDEHADQRKARGRLAELDPPRVLHARKWTATIISSAVARFHRGHGRNRRLRSCADRSRWLRRARARPRDNTRQDRCWRGCRRSFRATARRIADATGKPRQCGNGGAHRLGCSNARVRGHAPIRSDVPSRRSSQGRSHARDR